MVLTLPWATKEEARAAWPDAPSEDELLDRLLLAATEQCEVYAPVVATLADRPQRYLEACVLQAREIWDATRREGDVIGAGDYAVRARDLTSTVKALLRPRSVRKAVG